MQKTSLRQIILDVAERVIHDKGLNAATMEDVARAAELGTAVVFRYFPNKKALVRGILERYETILYALREEFMAQLPEQPSRYLKATLLALIDHPCKMNQSADNTIALLADKEMRHEIGRIKRNLFDDVLAATLDAKKTGLAMLIYDGIWVAEMSGECAYPSELVSEIAGELLASLDVPYASAGCALPEVWRKLSLAVHECE